MKASTNLSLGFLLTGFVFLCGCYHTPWNPTKEPKEEKIDSIVRVLMHEPGNYTLVIQGDSGELSQRYLCGKTRMITDVPKDTYMWATYRPQYDTSGSYEMGFLYVQAVLVIHLHSAEDINGAGWHHDNGKFADTYGETVIIR